MCAAFLAPLAVAPNRQRHGLGRLLVNTGFGRLWEDGILHIFVLDDPAYYGQLAIVREQKVLPPFFSSAEMGRRVAVCQAAGRTAPAGWDTQSAAGLAEAGTLAAVKGREWSLAAHRTPCLRRCCGVTFAPLRLSRRSDLGSAGGSRQPPRRLWHWTVWRPGPTSSRAGP